MVDVGMSDGAGLVKVDGAGSGAVLTEWQPLVERVTIRAMTETAMDVPETAKDIHRGAGLWGGSLMRMTPLYQGYATGCNSEVGDVEGLGWV